MPGGMPSHSSIGRPSVWTSSPPARRWAVAESPYGPAPITATSCCVVIRPSPPMVVSQPIRPVAP